MGVITLAKRLVDDIGGIEPSAEPDFEQQHIGGMAREQKKRSRGLDLEHRDRLTGIDALAFFQRGDQLVVRNQFSGQSENVR